MEHMDESAGNNAPQQEVATPTQAVANVMVEEVAFVAPVDTETETGSNEKVLRGQTSSFVHIDEAGFYQAPEAQTITSNDVADIGSLGLFDVNPEAKAEVEAGMVEIRSQEDQQFQEAVLGVASTNPENATGGVNTYEVVDELAPIDPPVTEQSFEIEAVNIPDVSGSEIQIEAVQEEIVPAPAPAQMETQIAAAQVAAQTAALDGDTIIIGSGGTIGLSAVDFAGTTIHNAPVESKTRLARNEEWQRQGNNKAWANPAKEKQRKKMAKASKKRNRR